MKHDICIPVSAAQALAESHDLRQVIIVAWDGEKTHVVTYGGTVEDSANAAHGGNMVKNALGWPDTLNAESPKVLALEARITELETRLTAGGLKALRLPPAGVFVIEGTEYERGWGQRPDGYVAFISEEAAKAFINEYDKKFNNKPTVPDEYTKYSYLGIKECSAGFYEAVASRKLKLKHFNKLSELLE